MLFEMTIAVYSMYNMNIAASNAARSVSIAGELTSDTSEKLYNEIDSQLSGRIVPGTLKITLSTKTAGTDYIPAQTVTLTKDSFPQYKVNIGDDFTVHLEAKVSLFHVANKSIQTTISATSSGVGEVYFKR